MLHALFLVWVGGGVGVARRLRVRHAGFARWWRGWDAYRDSQSIARLTRVDDDGRLAWIADEGRLTQALRGRPEEAKSHQFTNDAWGNLSTMRQLMAGGWTTMATFTWDTRGNMASFTDAKGVTLRYVHDDFGRLVEVSSPDFGLYRMLYDEAGNVSKVRRPDGAVLSYTYDASNQLLSVKSVAATLHESTRWPSSGSPRCAGPLTDFALCDCRGRCRFSTRRGVRVSPALR
jgi:YD repeat-containing protein